MSWVHCKENLKKQDGRLVPHPQTLTDWEDDMKKWPEIRYEDIFNYFVLSLGVDGSTMRNYKSTEAYQYVHSEKVSQVQLYILDDLVFLKADVVPSQSKADLHSAWVLTTSAGTIETAGCYCVAGQGKSCSHAAAILWKNVNRIQIQKSNLMFGDTVQVKVQFAVSKGLTGLSCTDEQRQWNSGTQRNVVPKRLNHINFKHHKANADIPVNSSSPCPSLPPTPVYSSHEEFKKSLEVANVPMGSLLHKCISAEPDQVPAAPTQLQQPHGEHGTDMQCQKCMSFYHMYINLDEDKIASFEEATKTQSASHLWFDGRKLRITASSAKKVPVRAITKPNNYVREHLYPRFHGNSATRHGQVNEEVTRAWIESCGYVVEKRGAVVSATEPWLSASPDGVLNSTELLEIKCPVLGKNCSSLTELFSSKFTDVKIVDGVPQLQPNGSRGYYLQIQLGMFCTRLERCKLLIWAPPEKVVIDVPFDLSFCLQVLPKMKSFYFTHMLPRIVDEFLSGRLTLSYKYLHMCN